MPIAGSVFAWRTNLAGDAQAFPAFNRHTVWPAPGFHEAAEERGQFVIGAKREDMSDELVRPDDHIVMDRLAHASLQTGATSATKNITRVEHLSLPGFQVGKNIARLCR